MAMAAIGKYAALLFKHLRVEVQRRCRRWAAVRRSTWPSCRASRRAIAALASVGAAAAAAASARLAVVVSASEEAKEPPAWPAEERGEKKAAVHARVRRAHVTQQRACRRAVDRRRWSGGGRGGGRTASSLEGLIVLRSAPPPWVSALTQRHRDTWDSVVGRPPLSRASAKSACRALLINAPSTLHPHITLPPEEKLKKKLTRTDLLHLLALEPEGERM